MQAWTYGFDALFLVFFSCFCVQVPSGISLWPIKGQAGREGTMLRGVSRREGTPVGYRMELGLHCWSWEHKGLVLPTGNKVIGIDLIVYHICHSAELSKHHVC